MTATFSGSSTAVVPVPTLTDNVLEGTENFTAVIQVPPDTTTNYRVTRGSPDTATMEIMDATSKWLTLCLSMFCAGSKDTMSACVFLVALVAHSAHLPGPLPLLAVAGVYFDPDVYMEPEGYTVTLALKTNVTVNKRFGVLVNTVDDSANSMYCIATAF